MLEVDSQLVADPHEVSLDLPRAGERCLDMRQHIFSAHMFEKAGLRDEPRRLIPRAAKQKRLTCPVQTVRELLDSMDTRCVKRRHIAEAQDDHVAKRTEVLGGLCQFLRRPEEERAMNAKDGHIGRDILVLQNVRLPVSQILPRNGATVVVSATR